MRIVHCNTVADRGGAANIAVNLCRDLISQGHQAVLAYGRGSKPDFNSLKIESEFESRMYGLSCRLFDNDGFAAHTPTKRLIEFLDEFKPDVFHLHNAHGYYLSTYELFLYLNANKIPVVWTLHDYWPVTGHCAFFSMAQCDKWKHGCVSKCPLKKQYPKSYLLDRSESNYALKRNIIGGCKRLVAVAPSRFMEKQVKSSDANYRKLICIPNGVDTVQFKYTESDLRREHHIENKKLILAVANGWGERKGYSDFIHLAKILPDEYVIVMIGFTKIPEGLPANIIPILRTSKEELIKWYSTADVFVSLSKDETFGLTSVEALACGTPIVLYNLTTGNEIVDSSCGRLCNNVQQVKNAIDELIGVRNISEHCVKRAEAFSLKRMCESYLELYSKCIETSK